MYGYGLSDELWGAFSSKSDVLQYDFARVQRKRSDEKYLQTALENSQQLEYYVNDEFDEDFDDDYDLDDDMQMRF